jgi:hypothetical protein
MHWRNETLALTGAAVMTGEPNSNSSQNTHQQQRARRSTEMNLNTKARITIATLNINGRQEVGKGPLSKWADIIRMVTENRISILAVQETHLDTANEDVLNTWYKDKVRIVNSADPDRPHASAGVS